MPVTFPSVVPTSNSWEIISNARQFVSPFTGAIQTAQRGGTRWRATLTFDNLSGAAKGEMQAFLAEVQATASNFYLENHAYARRADGQGTPRVNGPGQTGSQLLTDGWGTGDYAFLKGDMFEVSGELKMVIADAPIVSGGATVKFAPELRSAPENNESLILTNPKGIFRLTSNASGWATGTNMFSTLSLEAVEDILA